MISYKDMLPCLIVESERRVKGDQTMLRKRTGGKGEEGREFSSIPSVFPAMSYSTVSLLYPPSLNHRILPVSLSIKPLNFPPVSLYDLLYPHVSSPLLNHCITSASPSIKPLYPHVSPSIKPLYPSVNWI